MVFISCFRVKIVWKKVFESEQTQNLTFQPPLWWLESEPIDNLSFATIDKVSFSTTYHALFVWFYLFLNKKMDYMLSIIKYKTIIKKGWCLPCLFFIELGRQDQSFMPTCLTSLSP